MSEHKAVGEQIFIGGVGTGDYLCACGQFFPCDNFKANEAIHADRTRLAGLVEGLEGCQEVSDDFNTWLFYSPTGELIDRAEVLDIIRTTEIGEKR